MAEGYSNRLRRFCEGAPKVELHAHLTGCAREATLLELAAERNVTLSALYFPTPPPDQDNNSDAALDSSFFFYNTKPRSLQDCFDVFSEIPKCVNDLEALRRITREALEDFALDKVAYLELRSTPKRLRHTWRSPNLTTKMDYLEIVLSELEAFSADEEERYQREVIWSAVKGPIRLPLVSKLIVSVDRAGTADEALEHAQLAVELAQKERYCSRLVGLDLGGNPLRNDFRDFEAAFQLAKKSGLRTTVHIGEMKCEEATSSKSTAYEEAEAIISFRPDRLGHALLLPPSLNDRLHNLCIPIECCPTSNVLTLELDKDFHGNVVEGLRRHPHQARWLKEGYPISVCTDDPGVFSTSLSKELLLTAMAFDLDQNDVKSIVVGSMKHAFCTADDKREMTERLDTMFEALGCG